MFFSFFFLHIGNIESLAFAFPLRCSCEPRISALAISTLQLHFGRFTTREEASAHFRVRHLTIRESACLQDFDGSDVIEDRLRSLWNKITEAAATPAGVCSEDQIRILFPDEDENIWPVLHMPPDAQGDDFAASLIGECNTVINSMKKEVDNIKAVQQNLLAYRALIMVSRICMVPPVQDGDDQHRGGAVILSEWPHGCVGRAEARACYKTAGFELPPDLNCCMVLIAFGLFVGSRPVASGAVRWKIPLKSAKGRILVTSLFRPKKDWKKPELYHPGSVLGKYEQRRIWKLLRWMMVPQDIDTDDELHYDDPDDDDSDSGSPPPPGPPPPALGDRDAGDDDDGDDNDNEHNGDESGDGDDLFGSGNGSSGGHDQSGGEYDDDYDNGGYSDVDLFGSGGGHSVDPDASGSGIPEAGERSSPRPTNAPPSPARFE